MKWYVVFLLFIVGFVFLTCADDEDPCDVNHVIINDECVPDYIFPNNQNIQYGDKYYHKKYGLIIYKKGHWTNEQGVTIEELEAKTQQ